MIQRIVLVRLKDKHVDEELMSEIVTAAEDELSDVPGVRKVDAGMCVDERTDSSWDICLKLKFDELDAIEPYRSHPIHVGFVEKHLKPVQETLFATNFEW